MHLFYKVFAYSDILTSDSSPPTPPGSTSTDLSDEEGRALVVGDKRRDKEGRTMGEEVSNACAYNMHFVCK